MDPSVVKEFPVVMLMLAMLGSFLAFLRWAWGEVKGYLVAREAGDRAHLAEQNQRWRDLVADMNARNQADALNRDELSERMSQSLQDVATAVKMLIQKFDEHDREVKANFKRIGGVGRE